MARETSTIAKLITEPKPVPLPGTRAPFEFNVFKVNAEVTQIIGEADGDSSSRFDLAAVSRAHLPSVSVRAFPGFAFGPVAVAEITPEVSTRERTDWGLIGDVRRPQGKQKPRLSGAFSSG
jgi:hypothetical protein